ncbi:MAG TPA: type I-C CRISPR-associated endonuclease Cas1c [Bacteroidales bacterium]|jgi:CRISPR-associated protein Cas1|nr:type I-C CRISPR-associated endonuclease Cas1c [Bacteroidales bacterium]HQJ82811.1 type I-C CRISPR-associated endonuclease Cas1c [Bacteroidales bacterium]
MRKLLNTLFVTTPESYLSKDGQNVVVSVKSEEKFRIPIHNIEGIVCFGYMGASPALVSLCAEHHVGLSFASESGWFLGRFTGRVNGNVLLRRKQYRMADNEDESLRIAKIIVSGKLANCRNVLKRAIRDHSEVVNITAMEEVVSLLNKNLRSVRMTINPNELRGYEGDGATLYFSVFDQMILHQKEHFFFRKRSRRPPLDNVNALLSFVYVLLMHEITTALEAVGLDPYVGFLHRDRPGRQSFALDLMEEFRPYLADRLVLSLINRKQVNHSGFINREPSGVLMTDNTRKEVIQAWQKRKQETIVHPFLNEKIQIGLLPYAQALLFARFLRGDLENYPVFIMK